MAVIAQVITTFFVFVDMTKMDNMDGMDGMDKYGRYGQSIKRKGVFRKSLPMACLALFAAACSLLDRQLAAQAEAFTKEGGFTERLYRTPDQLIESSSSISSIILRGT